MRLIAALVSAIVIATFLAHPGVATPLKVEASLVLALSLVRPVFGLLAIAFVVPLGELVVPLIGAHPIRHADTLIVAFLAGWLGWRAAARDRAPAVSRQLGLALWIFGCLLVASVTTTALHLHRADPERARGLLTDVLFAYLVTDDPFGAHAAGNLLQGIGLLLAAADLSRRERRLTLWLPACLVASGVVVSVAASLLAFGIGTRETLARQLAVGLPRYSAAHGDVNAAGSSLLLLFGVGLGLAAEHRRLRILWLAASLAIAWGLVLAGSRTAFVAGCLVACIAGTVWLLRRASPKWIAMTLVAAAIVVVVGLVRAPAGAAGLEMRYGFTESSLRMIAARPLFGVGEGRYYTLSTLTLPPTLGWWYGRENAHNYFLQTAAELGVIGLAAFLWMVIAATIPAMTNAGRIVVRPAVAGCLAGAVAFLVTCLSGHPLLVPEAATPFWIVLGLMAGSQATADSQARRTWMPAAACAAALLMTVPFRPAPPNLRLSSGTDGFGPWGADERGFAFRAMHGFASLFVVNAIGEVEIPLRLERPSASGAVPVNIAVPGEPARQVRVTETWTRVNVPLPPADPLVQHVRINLAVDPVPGRTAAPQYPPVYVGQPRIVSTR